MEYQKLINSLDNISNQLSKFRTKNWIEINDSDIRFKTTMLKPSLCDYSDACILVKGTETIAGEGAHAAARWADEKIKV